MVVDHIGYAVKNIDSARETFVSLGFVFESIIEDKKRNLYIQFGKNGDYCVELLSKLDPNKESPIDSFIGKIGPTPYHLCYKSGNLDFDIDKLKKIGFRQITIADSAIAFEGRRVVFLYNSSLGIIELVEEEANNEHQY